MIQSLCLARLYQPFNARLQFKFASVFALLVLACLLVPAAFADNHQATASGDFDYKASLKTSQDAIGNELGDYTFTGSDGSALSLAHFKGKPLLISMVYSSCYEICPMTTRHLADVVNKARKALGDESFNAAVIGFDTQMDTPTSMRVFAVKQGIDNDPFWHALSIKKDEVQLLMNDLGFTYYPSSQGFDHIIQVSVIDSNGKVYRQVYGQAFSTPLLIEPLKELVLGKPTPAQSFTDQFINKVRLFCTTYDPVRDAYYFDYSLFIGMFIGGLIILLGVVFITKESLRS